MAENCEAAAMTRPRTATEVFVPLPSEKRPMRRRRRAMLTPIEPVFVKQLDYFEYSRLALGMAWANWVGRAMDRIERVDLSGVPLLTVSIMACIFTDCALACDGSRDRHRRH